MLQNMLIEEVPVIDLGCQSLTESTASSLLKACNELGFFFIRNHGVSKEFYEKLISGADELFSSPEETKQKLTMGVSSYTPRFVVSPFIESFRVSGPNFPASFAALGFTQSLFGHQAIEVGLSSPLKCLLLSLLKSAQFLTMGFILYDCSIIIFFI